ncbi:cobalt-precorrin-5B (C(1))-methyltransferase [Vibrio rarus]|uniref:cobalt-precorrin-5B (C(1))-methyltransferase n=1 Tax=Vibrio rarus TaxID=413403 RepID=UPI0021C3BAAA|nr:cobalt-precorrin-5B (C(1))-methyltransferase [Vibrio rarus]
MGKLKRSKHNKELRWGYTTGACAAAAASAAVRMLISDSPFSKIEISLPNKELVTFPLARLEKHLDNHAVSILAGVVKDGGDDPDCTHGLEIQCRAKWSTTAGIHLTGGQGIATVTLPGLELPVGEPAINPVPRANIIQMVQRELDLSTPSWSTGASIEVRGVELTILAPGGEVAAKETISERLGLIGGISILGTRGTVKPFSTSAYAASVRQSIQVAKTNGLQHVVLTTGSRSEKSAIEQWPALSRLAFVQAGDFMGVGLRAAKRYQIQRVSLVVMIGKLGKLISGRMMTHVSGHAIDFAQLSHLAQQSNMPAPLCQDIAKANTGRHVLDLVRDHQPECFLQRLCQEAQHHAHRYVANELDIEVVLIDFDGKPLAVSCGAGVIGHSRDHTQQSTDPMLGKKIWIQ